MGLTWSIRAAEPTTSTTRATASSSAPTTRPGFFGPRLGCLRASEVFFNPFRFFAHPQLFFNVKINFFRVRQKTGGSELERRLPLQVR